MKRKLSRNAAFTIVLLVSALQSASMLAQADLRTIAQQTKESSTENRSNVAAAYPPNLFVSKTAHVSGEDVCGVIRITNLGMGTATIVDIADTLEVRFQSNIPPYPMPAGSTPNWFKIADVLIAVPGPIAPRKTVTINYCFSLCQASDYPGAASMRNVVHVRVANPPGLPRVFPALSNVFLPPILDCQACCLPNGSCLDTLPARCSSAGGLPRGMGTDCATTECKQACCLGNGMCLDVKVSTCQANGGTPKGLATNCATTECPSACCLPSGSCAMQLVAACAAAGGLHQGPHVDCATTECPEACCHADDSCTDDPPSVCQAASGVPQGAGTDCASTQCCLPPFSTGCTTFADCCNFVDCNGGTCCNAIGHECGGVDNNGPCCDSNAVCDESEDRCCLPPFSTGCTTFADCCNFVDCNGGTCCNAIGHECGGVDNNGPCCDSNAVCDELEDRCCLPPFSTGCTTFADCCGETECNNGTCCNALGHECEDGVTCCEGVCSGEEICCLPPFSTGCTTFADCCNFVDCNNGTCCNALGRECGEEDGPCCNANAICQNSACCLPMFRSGCTVDSDCCPGLVCDNGSCMGVVDP